MVRFKLFFLIFFSTILFCSAQLGFLDCSEEEPSTRFLQVKIIENRTDLTVIEDGRPLNASWKTYIITHGWKEWPTKKTNIELARALLSREECNVILMDYSKWTRKFYNCATYMVTAAGKSLSKFLITAINDYYINVKTLHLIGYSLGAHVSGLAGKAVKRELGIILPRITGLDPAGPLFSKPFEFRHELALTKHDAKVVDVLHTTNLIGTAMPLGTVDFYARSPLESGIQLACINNPWVGCSHQHSRIYYVESVTSCGMKAEPSYEFDSNYSYDDVYDDEANNEARNDLVVFGHHMPLNTTGVYQFSPNGKAPFGSYPPECS